MELTPFLKTGGVPLALRKRLLSLIQWILGLAGPYIFCYLAGLRLPDSVGTIASDIAYMYLPLLLLIPYFLITMPLLKLFFYGYIKGKGLKIRVSNKTKRVTTYFFIAATFIGTVFIQAELFITMTDRNTPLELSTRVWNAFYLLVISAPGLFLSMQKARKKIATIEKLRDEATRKDTKPNT